MQLSASGCYVHGTYTRGLGIHVVIPLAGDIPELVLRDRPTGNSGSGPYFIARGQPESFTVDSGREYNCADVFVENRDDACYMCSFGVNSGYGFVVTYKSSRWGTRYWFQTQWHSPKDCDIIINESTKSLDPGGSPIIGYGRARSFLSSLTPDPLKKRVIHAIVDGKLAISLVSGVFTEPRLDFRHDEYNVFQNYTDLGIVLGGFASRWATAYTNASQDIPSASVNMIENIFDCIDAIKTLATVLKDPVKGLVSLVKDLMDPREAWLAYRYTYTTTKLDIESLKEFLNRVSQLKKLCNSYFEATGRFSDDLGSFGVSMQLPLSEVIPQSLLDWVSAVGFEPTATNLWDIVPWSFMVDWFLGISDIIEWAENWAYSLELRPTDYWFTYITRYGNQSVFFRVPGRALNVPPIYQRKSASGKTILMRFADVISIFS